VAYHLSCPLPQGPKTGRKGGGSYAGGGRRRGGKREKWEKLSNIADAVKTGTISTAKALEFLAILCTTFWKHFPFHREEWLESFQTCRLPDLHFIRALEYKLYPRFGAYTPVFMVIESILYFW